LNVAAVITLLRVAEVAVKKASIIAIIEPSIAVSLPSTKSYILSPLIE
jgi:hypothetical protein